jgi:hypothetical protein
MQNSIQRMENKVNAGFPGMKYNLKIWNKFKTEMFSAGRRRLCLLQWRKAQPAGSYWRSPD